MKTELSTVPARSLKEQKLVEAFTCLHCTLVHCSAQTFVVV